MPETARQQEAKTMTISKDKFQTNYIHLVNYNLILILLVLLFFSQRKTFKHFPSSSPVRHSSDALYDSILFFPFFSYSGKCHCQCYCVEFFEIYEEFNRSSKINESLNDTVTCLATAYSRRFMFRMAPKRAKGKNHFSFINSPDEIDWWTAELICKRRNQKI